VLLIGVNVRAGIAVLVESEGRGLLGGSALAIRWKLDALTRLPSTSATIRSQVLSPADALHAAHLLLLHTDHFFEPMVVPSFIGAEICQALVLIGARRAKLRWIVRVLRNVDD